MAALIRSHFKVDPYLLDEESFAQLAVEAQYLEEHYWGNLIRIYNQRLK